MLDIHRANKDDKNFKKNFGGLMGKKSGTDPLNLFAKIKFKITEKIIEKDEEMENPKTPEKKAPTGLAALAALKEKKSFFEAPVEVVEPTV